MKKNNFFSGMSAKLGLAVMALAGTLFASCEKEDFNATFEADAARAEITVLAYDAESGVAVTPTSIVPSEGNLSGSTIVITGTKNINAKTVTVTITCNGLTGTGSVNIPNLSAGQVGHYSITFIVGKDYINPTYAPAKATVTAKAVDGETGDEITTGVSYTFASTATGGVASGNVYTISATESNKTIPAQTVTVTATVEGLESALVETVDIPQVDEGHISSYLVIFEVIKGEQGDDVVTTYKITNAEPTITSEKRWYLTGNYKHTHAGIDQWLSNDSQYLMPAKVTYISYNGYEYVEGTITDSSETVIAEIDGWKKNSGITEVEETLTFDVSAWSIYAAWADVTTTTTDWTITKTVTTNGVAAEPEIVATYSIVTKSVVADHTEIPHPDHAHAYKFGHGHAHDGSSNAGGGIIYAD